MTRIFHPSIHHRQLDNGAFGTEKHPIHIYSRRAELTVKLTANKFALVYKCGR